MNNTRHIFKVFEEITNNKANKLITTVIAPKDRLVDCIDVSYYILDNIDEIRDFIFNNDRIFNDSAWFMFEDYYEISILFNCDEETNNIPTYYLYVEYIDEYSDLDEEVEEMYRIYRREGYRGVWHGSFMEPQKLN